MHGWQRPLRSFSGSWYLRRITPQVILDARQRLCGPHIGLLNLTIYLTSIAPSAMPKVIYSGAYDVLSQTPGQVAGAFSLSVTRSLRREGGALVLTVALRCSSHASTSVTFHPTARVDGPPNRRAGGNSPARIRRQIVVLLRPTSSTTSFKRRICLCTITPP